MFYSVSIQTFLYWSFRVVKRKRNSRYPDFRTAEGVATGNMTTDFCYPFNPEIRCHIAWKRSQKGLEPVIPHWKMPRHS